MNIPNVLTIIRLFLVPVFMLVYSIDSGDFKVRLAAAAVFIIASATDVLDGYIARKYNKITDFGKLADPVADKLMQLFVIGCLAFDDRISMWILVVFAFKELVLILGGLNLLKEKFVVQSKWSGKIATAILFLCIIVILVTDSSQLSKFQCTLMMSVSLCFTAIAFFDYMSMFIRVKDKMQKSKEKK